MVFLLDSMYIWLQLNCAEADRTPQCVPYFFTQVELIEMPFSVVTCQDILLVNLERVGFNLRNFDMTIVFKVSLRLCLDYVVVWTATLIFCHSNPP